MASPSCISKVKGFMRRRGLILTILTLIGVLSGFALGIGLKRVKPHWRPRDIIYFKFISDLFLRCVSALIIPLIVSTLISTIGSLDLSLARKIGIRAVVYYLSTSVIAAITSLIVYEIILNSAFNAKEVTAMQPGKRGTSLGAGRDCLSSNSSTVDTMLDFLRNLFPDNLIRATMQLTKTEVIDPGDDTPWEDWQIRFNLVNGSNLLGLVLFAMVFGITLSSMREAGAPLISVFTCLTAATMKIMSALIWISPVAICFLVGGQLLQEDDIINVLNMLIWYFATILTADIIHAFITLPLMYGMITKSWPIRFFTSMFQAIAAGFGTNSSAATIPITLECLENNNKIDKRITRFIVPIGATINMDGIALNVPIGVIYLAQLCGRDVGLGELVTVGVISVATSIGQPGIPGVAMASSLPALGAIGVPLEYIAYLLPLHWLTARMSTMLNVLGDAYGCAIVAHLSKSDLPPIGFSSTSLDEKLDAAVAGSENHHIKKESVTQL